MDRAGGLPSAASELQPSVSVVATNPGPLRELAHVLARAGIGIVEGRIAPGRSGGGVLDAFEAIEADPATEVIVLALDALPSDAAERLLERVRHGNKPTVVYIPGSDPRLAWRAGAIPATRLDEAALRAVAWVRDWDQALISSRLEEEGDQLAALAADLQPRIGPGRVLVRGLFASDALRHEAQLLLAGVLGEAVSFGGLRVLSGALDVAEHLRAAWANPACGVMLLSLASGAEAAAGPVHEAITAMQTLGRGGPVPIAHVCGDPLAFSRLAEAKVRLEEAGAVVVPSNASAALLAGLLIQRVTKGG